MRYGMRLGRNAWVTGGGGVLLVAIVSRLMLAMILGLLAVIAEITKCGVGLALDARQRSKDVRRSLLKSSIRGCVKRDTEAALSRAPQVWAVYVVGDEFHYGAYPGKGEQLEALFPDQVVAKVVVFPDVGRARRSAAQLMRHGFSFDELRNLTPECYHSRTTPRTHRLPG